VLNRLKFGRKKIEKNICISKELYQASFLTMQHCYGKMSKKDVLFIIENLQTESMYRPRYIVGEYATLYPADFARLPFLRLYLVDVFTKLKFKKFARHIENFRSIQGSFEDGIIFQYLQEIVKEIPDLITLNLQQIEENQVFKGADLELITTYNLLFSRTKNSLLLAINHIQETQSNLQSGCIIDHLLSKLDVDDMTKINSIYDIFNTHFLEPGESELIPPSEEFLEKITYKRNLLRFNELGFSDEVIEYKRLQEIIGLYE
jgi:hypothetical protein